MSKGEIEVSAWSRGWPGDRTPPRMATKLVRTKYKWRVRDSDGVELGAFTDRVMAELFMTAVNNRGKA